jgi:hypothetical protein
VNNNSKTIQEQRQRRNTDEQRSHYHRKHRQPVNPELNQPQQKQTAKEAIAANVQALIEQLEQGHSEGLTAYLTAMGRFHNYSFRQHFGDCTAEAGCNPRCWPVCVEPA